MDKRARLMSPLLPALILAGCSDLAMEHDRIPTELEIHPEGGLIQEDDLVQLEARIFDQHGERMPLPSWAPLVWEVSEGTVLSVSSDGLVSAAGGGEAAVRASLAGLGDATRFRINPSRVVLSAPVIYLNQAAQNREGSVALIAGRPALLRVFMVGDQTSYYGPGARVTILHGDEVVFQRVLAPTGDRTPSEVIESHLGGSVNGLVPGSVIQPGASMVVELDPEGLVPLGEGSLTRYPATGSTPLNVVEPQLFRQIIVPTISVLDPNESVYDWTDGLNPDHPRVRLARTLMPVGGSMELEVAETYRTGADLTTADGWGQWIRETLVLYEQEGGRGYYYGVVSVSSPAYGGLGYIGLPVSVGLPYDDIYAHELGHNMNLLHAPCGVNGDPAYPYPSGNIGIWGYDIALERLMDRTALRDVMSYCNPVWISDYHFTKATVHRLDGDGGVDLGGSPAARAAERDEMLVVWGSVRNGRLRLDPAFVLDGPPALPEADGPYRVEGLDRDGGTEFSLSFSPAPLEHGGGGFVFLVPWRPDWADALDRIVLAGPEGQFTLERSGTPPLAVVTDPSTGKIRAIVRDWDGGPLPGEGTANVTVSRGIPGNE